MMRECMGGLLADGHACFSKLQIYSEMPPEGSCFFHILFLPHLDFLFLLPFLCEKLNDIATAESKHSFLHKNQASPSGPLILCVCSPMRRGKAISQGSINGQSTHVC